MPKLFEYHDVQYWSASITRSRVLNYNWIPMTCENIGASGKLLDLSFKTASTPKVSRERSSYSRILKSLSRSLGEGERVHVAWHNEQWPFEREILLRLVYSTAYRSCAYFGKRSQDTVKLRSVRIRLIIPKIQSQYVLFSPYFLPRHYFNERERLIGAKHCFPKDNAFQNREFDQYPLCQLQAFFCFLASFF